MSGTLGTVGLTAVSLLFGLSGSGGTNGLIGTLQLDVLMNEEIELNSDITQYPVEAGSPVSDGIIPQQSVLRLQGFVMNGAVTLLGGLLGGIGNGGSLGTSKLISATSALKGIVKAKTPVTIVTQLGSYKNQGMRRCKIGRAGEGKGGEISIDAEFITISNATVQSTTVSVNSDTSQVDPSVAGKTGATGASAGKVTPTEPVSEASTASATSLLSKAPGALTAGINYIQAHL